jgi:hypothetical protein
MTRVRAARVIAAGLIGLAILAAFHTGITRNLHSTFADQSWGRVQFSIGAAVTSLYHGGYGYTTSDVVRTVLASAGLTGDPVMLKYADVTFPDNLRDPSLMENAIKKAIAFNWPFNPDQQVTGSSGEDVGLVDYVRLSFVLFGNKVVAFYFTYFALVATSFVAAMIAFRKMPGVFAVLTLYAVALFTVFKCNLLDFGMVGILDPRFLSTLSLVPAFHVAMAMFVRARLSPGQVALVLLQSAILVFGYWIRSSAFWTILWLLPLAVLLAGNALWRRDSGDVRRIWPFAILGLLAVGHFLLTAQALHPVYQTANERPHHALWHAMIYGVAIHPDWPRKYAGQFGLENVDETPEMVAKRYLLRHPPKDPDAVYLTPDRQYLRIGAAETYKRKAFLEFLGNDPRFVTEAFLIYKPKLCIKAFRHYLSSFDRLSTAEWITLVLALLVLAILLVPDRHQRWTFTSAMLIVSFGFFVSMVPMLVTAPGPAVMADQLLMLIVSTTGWAVAAASYVIGWIARLARPASWPMLSEADKPG